jgi:hypothetical protein
MTDVRDRRAFLRNRRSRLTLFGFAVAVVITVTAMVIPAVTGWNVHVKSFPPLHAEWAPRLGPGSIPAVALAVMIAASARKATTWPWRRLLLVTFVFGAAWLTSLGLVDGWDGIGHILDTDYEYLQTARAVTDIPATLREYVSRIPFDHPQNWPVHIAGHPAGALLFFIMLVRVGLGGGLAAGFVVILVSATTPIAVLLTLRRLGAESAARKAAPFLVAGPAAIWMAVSADAVFGAIAAWGIFALACGATASTLRARILWSIGSGLLLGYGVMMSYGFALFGILALAVLFIARSWWPLPIAAAAALAVVLAFAAAGFAWWEAYPVLVQRYWDGIASRRPGNYWIWGNLAALVVSAGPVIGATVATALGASVRLRRGLRRIDPVVVLTLAGLAMVLAADLSRMSRAEVERIWLPFVPWLLIGTAMLGARWRRASLIIQLTFAVVVQHLLLTGW